MKIYQLKVFMSDCSCGNSEQILCTTHNKQQLTSIANRFNKKYGSPSGATDYITKFNVTEIDTTKIKDTLTNKEILQLWE